MNRDELRHILRAASRVTGDREIVVAGSQAILGSFNEKLLPSEATRSEEADLLFLDRDSQDKIDTVDGSIGEAGDFHRSFGVYAQGIDASTARLPTGWKDRLVPFEVGDGRGSLGFCLDPNDLAASKLAAGRDKDFEFVRALIEANLVSTATIGERLAATDLPAGAADGAMAWLTRFDTRADQQSLRPPVAPPNLRKRLNAWLARDRGQAPGGQVE